MVTFFFGAVFFAMAMLALSVGVIFKKKTPLKGHCHKPVDGSDGCAACGDSGGSSCSDVVDGYGVPTRSEDTIASLKQGQFQIQRSSKHIEIRTVPPQ
ncbi:MAG: hypothetical protein JXX29_15455 [Deltaproteobacteria bacterium]|nr:hypothetical protein [Deltaproteobacteria bacterium]MBN2673079.1 hypothetical protein [Deltaproteobacteria bacterium]